MYTVPKYFIHLANFNIKWINNRIKTTYKIIESSKKIYFQSAEKEAEKMFN